LKKKVDTVSFQLTSYAWNSTPVKKELHLILLYDNDSVILKTSY